MKHDGEVNSAQFSPDGKWIVTVSTKDKSVRVWDTETGKPLTEPMKHDKNPAISLADMILNFSPDNKRIVTAFEGTMRVWDVMPAGKAAPEWLPRLADAIAAGQHLSVRGFFEPLNKDSAKVLGNIKDQLSREPADDDWAILGRWFLADRSTRTISPFSKITIPEYIENRIKENTSESLDEAEQLAVGNAELLERIARRQGTSSRPSLPSPSPLPNPFGR